MKQLIEENETLTQIVYNTDGFTNL